MQLLCYIRVQRCCSVIVLLIKSCLKSFWDLFVVSTHKAIVAVEDENDEITALNLLKQVEELRERQRNRLDTQKKGLQHTQLLQTHEEEGMQSASNYLKAAKDEFNEKEESARLAKAKSLLLDRNLTGKKLELEQMRKELNELREFASSHNSWGGGIACVPPNHLALAQQDYNEIISDFVHHMDDIRPKSHSQM